MKNCLSFDSQFFKQILIAPNAFKGTMEAEEFCRILANELHFPPLFPINLPMCDGGDGSAAIIASYLNAAPVTVRSLDALGRPKTVSYYTKQDTAIVDLASICGIKDLHPQEYDVLNASTAGLGKVLLHIARQGIRRIILGVGGSASIDGGCGALAEMGLKIVKQCNQYRNHLIEIKDLEIDKLKNNFKNIEFIILCDVTTVLCGNQGAAYTFGPQKGATSLQVSMLDHCLQRYAALLLSITGVNVTSLRYGGAAGGIAAAFHTLLDARLISGADYCLQLSGFNELLPQSKLVITGEGKLDRQSMQGKLPGRISTLCHNYHIPVIAVVGSSKNPYGFDRIYTLLDYAENLPAAMRHPGYYLRLLANDLKRDILKLI